MIDEPLLGGMMRFYDRQGNLVTDPLRKIEIAHQDNTVAVTNIDGLERVSLVGTKTILEPRRVSTVFLCFDHNPDPDGPRQIFETIVFDGKGHELLTRRYAMEAEAREGHLEIVRAIGQHTYDD